jgi:outer membrane protein assembly factor BamB
MITTPTGYAPESPGGWFRNLTRDATPDLNFRLVPDKKRGGDTLTMAQLTDLHIGQYPWSWIADDIAEIIGVDCIVSTGDVTQSGKPEEFTDYLRACESSRYPIIHVPGNHDWIDDKSGETWTRLIGPLYFSLDWGPVHLVAYDSTAPRYTEQLPVDEWLAADLAHVPPDRPVVFLIHAQFEDGFYSGVRTLTNPARNIVATLSGHWHSSRLFDDGETHHLNQPTTSMGGIDYAARGYSVVTVDSAGNVTLTRRLLGTNQRSRYTGIASVPEPPDIEPATNAAAVQTGDSWAQFHGGPARTGYHPNGSMSSFKRAWQARLPGGILFGSPVIADGAAYIAAQDEFDPNGGHLVCVDAANGTARWQIPTHGSVKHAPAVVNGIVYAVTVSGRVFAIDAESGDAVWEYQLGDASARWIFSSPLVVGKQVVVGQSGHFVSLDADTGRRNWLRTDLVGNDWISSYPSPAADHNTVYVGFFWHRETLWALDRETGETRWVVADIPGTRGPAATPVAHIDSDSSGEAKAVYVLCHDGVVRALAATDGELLWQFDLGQDPDKRGGARWSPGTPALADEILYVPTGDGFVRAVDTRTATQIWSWQADPALAGVQAYDRDGSSILSSPIVVGDTVITGSSDGRIVALDRTDGAVDWFDMLDAPIIGSPAISGNLLICSASDGWLYAWTSD